MNATLTRTAPQRRMDRRLIAIPLVTVLLVIVALLLLWLAAGNRERVRLGARQAVQELVMRQTPPLSPQRQVEAKDTAAPAAERPARRP